MRHGWRVKTHCETGQSRVLDGAGKTVAQGTEAECIEIAGRAAPTARNSRGVVLLHGILNDPEIMRRAENALRRAGWAVANLAYPSTRLPLEAHARSASLVASALAESGAHEICFVGHSLGGLVARAAMARADADGWRPGRMVLVGSPARGAMVARMLQPLPGYKSFLGPCGTTVTPAGAACVPMPMCRGVAVIAGGTGGRGFNPLLDGDNDFTVTVAETRMPEVETAFLRVRALHNPLMEHHTTIAATCRFLETGRIADGLHPGSFKGLSTGAARP